ncbi:MAG: hypothetical protein H6736_20510 [Alphaproteobacteria bacterium]|nr:hypothetical protein [Alphaproteobacteria bacterium]
MHHPTSIDLHIVLVGLRRCGNHAVTNWLLALADHTAHFNNVEPTDPWGRPPDHLEARPDGSVALAVTSFEDRSLHLLKRNGLASNPNVPPAGRVVTLLLLRDPLNLFASQQKSRMLSPAHLNGLSWPQLYTTYAREFAGRTRHLPGEVIPVRYDAWKDDSEARRALAERLGLSVDREQLDAVSAFGGGSSFDGKAFDGAGSRMKTGSRWRVFADDPHYRKALAREELLRFTLDTFDLEPEAAAFAERLLQEVPPGRAARDELAIGLADRTWARVRSIPGVRQTFLRVLALRQHRRQRA